MVKCQSCALGESLRISRLRRQVAVAISLISMACGALPVALGQLPVTELTAISPSGATHGSQVEVQTFGANQEDGTQLQFSHPGIKAVPKQAPRNEFVRDPHPVAGKFDVSVSKDVPPGIYDVRLASRFGVSNPRSFVVGAFPEAADKGNNRPLVAAQKIELPMTVNGVADANSTDYYKLHLASGSRVLVECLAQRIDSRMDAALAIYSADGRELKRNFDSIGRDPMIDFTASAEGDYVIAVWDFFYEGGNDYFYRLNVGQQAHVDYIFPPSGLAGTRMATTLFGRNLTGGFPVGRERVDGVSLEAKPINIDLPANADTLSVGGYLQPQSADIDGISYSTPDGSSLFVGVSSVPVIVELEPNNEASAAQVVPVPCEIAGQFFPRRDADVFQFDMRKGEKYRLEVISQRMGLETDPLMIIEKLTRGAEGKITVSNVAQVDDSQGRTQLVGSPFDTSTDDPSYRLSADSDSTYRVTVRDQFGDGPSDPRWVYRFAVRPLKPDFRLHAVPEETRVANPNEVRLTSLAVRRGGTVALKVAVERRDDFDGDIAIEVEGLPAGVQCPSVVLGSNRDTVSLVFLASEDANPWAGPIRIIGRAESAGQKLIREARYGAILWGTANKTLVRPEFRLTREFYLAVVPEVIPALVKATVEPVLESSLGGKFDIPLELTRRGGFAEAVKLVAQDVPAELKPADVDIAADKSAGKLAISLTNSKLKPGVYTFHLRSDTKFKYSRNPEAVAAAEADLQKLNQVVAQLTAKAAELKTARDTTNSQSSATAAEKTAAEEAVRNADATLKRATDLKVAEEKRIADLKKSSAPADVNVALVSTPIQIRVVRSPLKLALPKAQIGIERGKKTELDVSLERKYGFSEAVELTLELPSEASGVAAEKVSLAADKSVAKLIVSAAESAKPGNVSATLRAKAKFNGVDVDDSLSVALTIP